MLIRPTMNKPFTIHFFQQKGGLFSRVSRDFKIGVILQNLALQLPKNTILNCEETAAKPPLLPKTGKFREYFLPFIAKLSTQI